MKKIEISTRTPSLTEDEKALFGSKGKRDQYHYLIRNGAEAYRRKYPGPIVEDPVKLAVEETVFRNELRKEFEAPLQPQHFGEVATTGTAEVIAVDFVDRQILPDDDVQQSA